MSPHPQVQHLLAALKDALLEITPEWPSLDLVASAMVRASLTEERLAVLALASIPAPLREEINVAAAEIESAVSALDAAAELHDTALRRLSNALIAAAAGKPDVTLPDFAHNGALFSDAPPTNEPAFSMTPTSP